MTPPDLHPAPPDLTGPPQGVDHLVYAVPDLEEALPRVEAALGVRPVLGGHHPAWGTRNALLALGSQVYLELVGPDPDREGPRPPTLFQVDRIREPGLATWCARAEALEARASSAAAAGVVLGPILEGGRTRPDGTRITWRLSDPQADREGGILPFLIAWGETPHPAGGLPGGARDGLLLQALRAEHPEPERLRRWFRALGVEIPVAAAPVPALVAVLQTPMGEVVHRSDSPAFPSPGPTKGVDP
jgi:hypothetical protein